MLSWHLFFDGLNVSNGRAPRFQRENALLLAACPVNSQLSQTSPDQSLDWHYVLRAADIQGVAPLLHDWLTRHREIVVPKPWAERLYSLYWTNHFRNRILLSELGRVCRAAAEVGFDLMPLKGASLAGGYYRTPALRPLSDLDLLVRPHDLGHMSRLLRALGYQEVPSQPSYLDDGWLDDESREHCWVTAREDVDILIEYRTEPLEPAVGRLTDLDPPFMADLRRHAATVWTRAIATGDGTSVLMSREDLLLHVAIHLAAKHVSFRLIWLSDLARIVASEPDLDWDYVLSTSARLRVAAPVHAALEAAARWIGAPIPVEHLEHLRAASNARSVGIFGHRESSRLRACVALLNESDLTVDGPAVWPLGSALSRLQGWRARFRALRWVAWPSRAYLADHGFTASGPLGHLAAGARRYAHGLKRLVTSLSLGVRRLAGHLTRP